MSYYKYNDNDIYYIIQRTGSSSSPYNGFPTSPAPQYSNTSQIDKPNVFNYKVNAVDLSNSNTAYNNYYNVGTFPVSYSIINSSPVTYFKHISGYCIGGSGGGGGGGGAYTGPAPKHGGGYGAAGGVGKYAAVVQYQIINPGTDLVSVTVGSGGGGGPAGGKSPNGSAGDGSPGNVGLDSSLKIGNTSVLVAYGGGSGNRGNGANKSSDGTPGSTNSTPSSFFVPGKNGTTIPDSPSPGFWPPSKSVAGNAGNSGTTNQSANGGGPGSNGYAQLWFSYEA